GRFGPYLQLGEGEGDEKPKRSSIPKGIDAATIDFEKALQLLSLPREVGTHPETGTPIVAGLGRYGPFIQHDGTYANLDSVEDVFTVGLNRAVTLLAEKRAGKGGGRFGRAAVKTVLKDLGEHPGGGGRIQVLDGKYGPYVSWNKVNATVPKGTEPAALTIDEAIRLLQERAAKVGGKKPTRGKPAAKGSKKSSDDAGDEAKPAKAKPKAAAKKPAAKKAPAKKAAAKAKADAES
ncbi:MAG: topoisomerase C-terminal repeat-containing protein, partial [Hyphomicrobium sp.]